MFSGQTLGALTWAQEGASNLRQAINSDVANQIVSQFGSNGEISLSQIETALGASGSTTAGGSTSSSTVSTLDASTSSNTVSTLNGLASAFASIDTNGDGELSTTELTNALNQMTGPGQVAGHHGHHHHHGGGDGDGQGGGGSLTLTDIENALSALTASLSGAGSSGSTTSGGTSSGSTSSSTVSTVDATTASTPSTVASTTPSTTSSNTVSTFDGLTTTEITQALQAFLNSLAQSQAANLAALGQTTNPTSLTA